MLSHRDENDRVYAQLLAKMIRDNPDVKQFAYTREHKWSVPAIIDENGNADWDLLIETEEPRERLVAFDYE
jgi:hypothetical protein